MELFPFQASAASQIAERFTDYMAEPLAVTPKQLVPFYQNLFSITGSGKTLILADAIEQIRRGWLVFVPDDRAGWEGALQSAPTDVLAAALASGKLADKPSLVADLALDDDDDRDKVMRAWGVDLDRRDGEKKIGELAARLAWCEDWAEWRKLQLRLREELKCLGMTSERSWPLLG